MKNYLYNSEDYLPDRDSICLPEAADIPGGVVNDRYICLVREELKENGLKGYSTL